MSKPFLLSNEEIKTILLKQNYVSQEDLTQAENYSQIHDSSLVRYLTNQNILTRNLFGQAVAEHFKVPYVDFEVYPMTKEKTELLNARFARSNRVVVAQQTKAETIVATDNPGKKGLMKSLRSTLKTKKIRIAYALPDAIDEALFWYRPELSLVVKKITNQNNEDAPAIIDAIFEDAIIRRVSDIHFEPQKNEVVIRFRVDGVLVEMLRVDHALYDIMINRIKVSAGLRIDEHFGSQDGSLHYETEEYIIDMRVSIVPITSGEKIVIRLLGEYVRGLSLAEVGMLANDQKTMLDAIQKPFGMILVVGPTGSGKTTTLYSLVKLLNKPGVNITTIEDPVEYKIPGVNQIQVNEQTGLDFAKGLRSIVRQDPDIILVGEIRDRETAEIAVNAALTGHLVLSTFHANDAATAIPRLLDMGIEPFLLASTLELVIGQRLVRTLRKDTRKSKQFTKKEMQKEYPQLAPFVSGETTLYLPAEDTTVANPFSGRTALFEMVSVQNEMQDLVMTSPSSQDIWKLARKKGSISMFEDGVEKLKLGVTTPDELLRIVEPPSTN